MSNRKNYTMQTSDKKNIITWDDGDRLVIDIKQEKELMITFIRDNVSSEMILSPSADNCFKVKIISLHPLITG